MSTRKSRIFLQHHQKLIYIKYFGATSFDNICPGPEFCHSSNRLTPFDRYKASIIVHKLSSRYGAHHSQSKSGSRSNSSSSSNSTEDEDDTTTTNNNNKNYVIRF